GRAVRELDRWYELVPPRFHDLVDIANARGVGINAGEQLRITAKDLLDQLVSAMASALTDAAELADLNAVVGGKRRYGPVTDVRASFGRAEQPIVVGGFHVLGVFFGWGVSQLRFISQSHLENSTAAD
ncbi:MAG: hypothetical protein EBZ48_15560, partial [Proteobacteria bacterium]|nr:hypothetical protein [Pseudomonadota bacterium]